MKSSTRPTSRKPSRGSSLAEVTVSLALISLVLVSMQQVLHHATRYLRNTTLTNELQQASVISMGRLVTEILESNSGAVRGDSVNHRYVSFASLRDNNDEITFADDQLLWHAFIGYYIDTTAEEPKLCRKRQPMGTPSPGVPTVPATLDEGFWQSYASARQIIAQRVYYLDVTASTNIVINLGVRSKDGKYVVTLQTKLKARN